MKMKMKMEEGYQGATYTFNTGADIPPEAEENGYDGATFAPPGFTIEPEEDDVL